MPDLFAEKGTDDAIADDWSSIQEKYAVDDEPAPVEIEPKETSARSETAVTGDETPASVEAKPNPAAGDRTRDAEGKFVKQPKAAAKTQGKPNEPAPAAGAAVQTSATPGDGVQPDVTQRDINRAPSSWRPTARAEWDKVSPAIRAEIHRRESDFANGQAQLLPDAQMGREMRQTIEPYRMLIDQTGAPAHRVIGDVLRDVAVLRTGTEQQKYQTMARIAQFHGIDLRRFAAQPGQQPQGQQQPGTVPQQQQFRDPRVDQILADQQNRERQRLHDEQQQTQSAVDTWMNETDAQGNPKRPYIGDVINEMSALVPAIRQANPAMTHTQALDAAYDRASWAHPEVRALLEKQKQTDLEEQRRAENQRQVGAARRAGSVSVARRASTPSAGPPGTIEKTIEDTARALGFFS